MFWTTFPKTSTTEIKIERKKFFHGREFMQQEESLIITSIKGTESAHIGILLQHLDQKTFLVCLTEWTFLWSLTSFVFWGFVYIFWKRWVRCVDALSVSALIITPTAWKRLLLKVDSTLSWWDQSKYRPMITFSPTHVGPHESLYDTTHSLVLNPNNKHHISHNLPLHIQFEDLGNSYLGYSSFCWESDENIDTVFVSVS